MRTIKVILKANPYNICVGKNILSKLGIRLKSLGFGKDAIVITSAKINRLHGRSLTGGLKRSGLNVKVFLVPDGEISKSAQERSRL